MLFHVLVAAALLCVAGGSHAGPIAQQGPTTRQPDAASPAPDASLRADPTAALGATPSFDDSAGLMDPDSRFLGLAQNAGMDAAVERIGGDGAATPGRRTARLCANRPRWA